MFTSKAVILWNNEEISEDTDEDSIVVLYRMKRISLRYLYQYTSKKEQEIRMQLYFKYKLLYTKNLVRKQKNTKAVS